MIPWEPLGCDYLATIWQPLHFHKAMFQPWLQKMTLYPSLADSGSQSGSCWRAGGNRVTRRQSGVVGRLQEPNAAPRRQRERATTPAPTLLLPANLFTAPSGPCISLNFPTVEYT